MIPNTGIFGFGANFEDRYIPDWDKLQKCVEYCRGLGFRIVLTQGTYDLIHIGHMKYLEKARSFGDVLIVGVDSDEKVRRRKGPNRPIVPEAERVHILVHLRHVTVVTLKPADTERHALIKLVQPDVLVVSKSTGENVEKNLPEYQKLAGEVMILEPQALTSTTARVRLLNINGAQRLVDELHKRFPAVIQEAFKAALGGGG